MDPTSADHIDARTAAERTGGLHLSEWACELIGTALLLLGGLSAIALDFGRGCPVAALLPSASARLLLTGMGSRCRGPASARSRPWPSRQG